MNRPEMASHKKGNRQLFLCAEIIAVEKLFHAALIIQDTVFIRNGTCQEPKELFALEVRYDKIC